MKSESTHEHCLLCNHSDLRTMKRYAAHHLVQCGNCGFVFAGSIPGTDTLLRHYEGYGRKNYLSPITVKRYEELLTIFERFRKNNRLLDVGCGIGYFLVVAKAKNWEVHGTEFTDDAIRICREKGLTVQQGMLQTGNYEPSSFDVITTFEVIEHINNPKEEVRKFHSLLRKGGIVYVTTPNFQSLSRLLLREKWNVIAYPEHLSYYTQATLTRLFTEAGFSLLNLRTTGMSITRLKTSLRLSGQSFIAATSDDERLRGTLESNRLLKMFKSMTNQLLSGFRIGDSIKATFIKN